MLLTRITLIGILLVGYGGASLYEKEKVLQLNKKLLEGIFQKKYSYSKSSRRTIDKTVVDAATGFSTTNPKVETTSGTVLGVTTNEGHSFYEIPYAEPPVGELRWQEPKPIETPLPDINATTNHFLHCYVYPGRCFESDGVVCPFYESEDCLVLNVYVPTTVNLTDDHANPPNERLPVMFYIHGGSFKSNAGTEALIHGTELANVTNNVVVTINYRLGALGFFTHEETGQSNINGNQGLKDQRLALQWVKDNIANFGGDKDRVMLFGNSAGAQSITFHTISSESKDLYSCAIHQSNPAIYNFYYPNREVALRISDRFVKAMRCNNTSTTERQCLIDTSPEEIVAQMPLVEGLTATQEGVLAYAEETFLPMIDGEEYTDTPIELYRTGQWNKDKSMIIGVNTQESENTQFYLDEDTVFDEQAYLGWNIATFGNELGNVIFEKYKTSFPPPEGEDYGITLGKEISHYNFDCPSRLMARYASNTTTASVYFYANSHPVLDQACLDQNNDNKTGCYLASHASEIRHVFRTVPQNDDFTSADQVVENEFSTYWGSFARTASPSNGLENPLGNFPSWPEYTMGGGQQPWSHLHITAPLSKVESGYKEDICDFWDGINYGVPVTTVAPSLATATGEYLTSESGMTTTSQGYKTSECWVGITLSLFLLRFYLLR